MIKVPYHLTWKLIFFNFLFLNTLAGEDGEIQRMKKLFDLNKGNRFVIKGKRGMLGARTRFYLTECQPGREAWKTLLIFLLERIPPGTEKPKGKYKYTTIYMRVTLPIVHTYQLV